MITKREGDDVSEFTSTEKNRVKRRPDRGRYDKPTVYAIIDEAMLCHIGFVQDGQPFVIPALHARQNDALLIHGASASRLIKHIQAGNEVSISIAILDAVVVAKTAFNQSVNYRSVVLFGKGRLIKDDDEKLQALEYFTERLIPKQWEYIRKPSPKELKATSIVAISIEEASAKIRNAPPGDDGEDRDLPIWAGLLPVKQVIQAPVSADYTDDSIPVPKHIMKKLTGA
jgi:nitroimidazol reductase NimA-like FMN-containing flavoprotein (pyridoxamine 5'-phosphate oxidase superfamily)